MKDDEGKEIGPKPEDKWNTIEELAANYKSKALNAIFSRVGDNHSS